MKSLLVTLSRHFLKRYKQICIHDLLMRTSVSSYQPKCLVVGMLRLLRRNQCSLVYERQKASLEHTQGQGLTQTLMLSHCCTVNLQASIREHVGMAVFTGCVHQVSHPTVLTLLYYA